MTNAISCVIIDKKTQQVALFTPKKPKENEKMKNEIKRVIGVILLILLFLAIGAGLVIFMYLSHDFSIMNSIAIVLMAYGIAFVLILIVAGIVNLMFPD